MEGELIAQFDTFLKKHIRQVRRSGSDKDIFHLYQKMKIMVGCAEKLHLVEADKYFFIIVDSVLEVKHLHQ